MGFDTRKLALVLIRVAKHFITVLSQEIGEEVTCKKCRETERQYDLVPKKKD